MNVSEVELPQLRFDAYMVDAIERKACRSFIQRGYGCNF